MQTVTLTLCYLAGSDKHRLLSQVVRPQDPLLRSPPRSAPPTTAAITSDEKPASHWKDEERRGDKREARARPDEQEARGRGGGGRSESLTEITTDSRSRGRDLVEEGGGDERDGSGSQAHEEGKKKAKAQKKGLKKVRKEEEGSGLAGAGGGDRFNPEPPNNATAAANANGQPLLYSPRKGAKKKVLDRKRKRSRGAESDVSDEEAAAPQPHSKKKRGPRTPPPSLRPDRRGTTIAAVASPLSKVDNFSDWSDEEVSDRTGGGGSGSLDQAAPPPAERPRGGPSRGIRERERCNPPPIAPLLSQETPLLLQTLTPQPLMSQPLLRKLPPEAGRSGGLAGVQARASARRLRSPSNESAHRDEPPGPRSRRGRLPAANSRDRERERERQANEAPATERKSRIDQLRRGGELSRSTSSGRKFNSVQLCQSKGGNRGANQLRMGFVQTDRPIRFKQDGHKSHEIWIF